MTRYQALREVGTARMAGRQLYELTRAASLIRKDGEWRELCIELIEEEWGEPINDDARILVMIFTGRVRHMPLGTALHDTIFPFPFFLVSARWLCRAFDEQAWEIRDDAMRAKYDDFFE